MARLKLDERSCVHRFNLQSTVNLEKAENENKSEQKEVRRYRIDVAKITRTIPSVRCDIGLFPLLPAGSLPIAKAVRF